MPSVSIVTDSVACLPQELVGKYGITVVPLDIVFQGRVYRDGVDMTPEEFYRLLERAGNLPTTTSASPGTYLETFRRLGERTQSILCITVVSRLSAVFDAARAARELLRQEMPHLRIDVLNSGTAAMAEGFVVLAAARAAALGNSLEATMESARSVVSRINLVALLDTLYYLARGGRVPRAAAWAASVLKIKPILQLAQGQVSILERVRTQRRGVERLLEIMKERSQGASSLRVAVLHASAAESAQRLKEMAAFRFACAELYVTQFTPVMGVHTGPGLLGLAFYAED